LTLTLFGFKIFQAVSPLIRRVEFNHSKRGGGMTFLPWEGEGRGRRDS